MFYSNGSNYLNHPNLLLIVNKSKKIEVSEIIIPNIISGLDVSSSLASLLVGVIFLSFLKRRLEKGFITIKYLSLVNPKF